MSHGLYDPDFIENYFDDFGEREWTRLINTDEIKLHIHSYYLTKHHEIRADADRWNELLEIELEACRQSGSLDVGTHLVAVVAKKS